MLEFEDRASYGDLPAHIERLERLSEDLRALCQGQEPSAGCLDEAPLLNPYSVTTTKIAVLAGWVDKHPDLGGPKAIVTSPIWFMADDLTWARTYSRYYRLGRPMGDTITVN